MAPAQAYVTSYPPRIRQYANTLLQPVLQTQNVAPAGRTTKRGTTIINYADDAYDEDDFEDSEGPRRPTGLRSLRREEVEKKEPQNEKLGRELREPVDLQPIYRDWMIRRTVRPTIDEPNRTDAQAHIQSQLPLTLIPIRIDLDVPAHQPDAPFPLSRTDVGINPSLPMFKKPEPLPGYKIRDIFLWNLHENLLTPDDFAQCFVRELDLPNQTALAMNVSQQIRTQLEDYAGVAMHPLFHTQQKRSQMPDANSVPTPSGIANGSSRGGTPRPIRGASIPRPSSTTPGTPAVSTPMPMTLTNGASVAAVASPLPPAPPPEQTDESEDPYLNPDDTYRCIITLSIYLSSRLYQDKFEWSLLHPSGAAEAFARQTCADMGLGGEWVMAITHAIYEAVLRLKKEACEGGMLMLGGNAFGGEIDNQAVRHEESAGWRYDIDDFGAEWEPKFEALSKEEIEKREGDRERQLRRLRRETAKFSSTAGMVPSAREQEAQQRGSYFDYANIGNGGAGDETPQMGRGERSKKKRRFRSLSPVAKAQTPEAGSSAGAGWGGEGNRLQEYERQNWRCKHCLIWGSAVWAVRDGPLGPRVSRILPSLNTVGYLANDFADTVQFLWLDL
ncbi:RSC complex subunit Sfh1 [Cladophialophora carrionii]|uniref:RSC complex subunit Sfh1 n=1 Tax=Cladophialophora carrionii TaxID=86049 RepID=A0A1C1D3D5_9EURO|nr:RSC complex subunit Sfh1 [Cladophialophora carrionii]